MYTRILSIALLFLMSLITVYAQTGKELIPDHPVTMDHNTNDKRISLNLPHRMKAQQLANMRSHVEALREIIGLLAKGDFDRASAVAHRKLGLTEDMKRMCGMFPNEDFRAIGLQFHRSADDLAETLRTRDMAKALQGLHDTMDYCVQCHATFRQ